MSIDTLNELVNKGLEALLLTDTYLVDVKVHNKKIEVYLDSDEQVTFEKCRQLSRWLEAILDESSEIEPDYTLEVSSAGVGNPLKLLRQYKKNIGRNIAIKYSGDKVSKGILTAVEGDEIKVEYETKIKEGKKNKKVLLIDSIRFSDIIESKIKISYNS
ncbi:MAG: ribosome assembly cofactor RimP [Lewinellaceae bacterium]|nr:ribosome assembly cofactor RimP [Lewinellaceae bacterium]